MKRLKYNKQKNNSVKSSDLRNLILKDGRRVFTTHNNFRYWLEDKNGKVISITEEYFKTASKNVV